MKRSEMLKILRDSFIYHINPTGPAESDEEMYDNILSDLEKACYENSYNSENPLEWEEE